MFFHESIPKKNIAKIPNGCVKIDNKLYLNFKLIIIIGTKLKQSKKIANSLFEFRKIEEK